MNYYQQHQSDFLEGLKTFLRIPSISTLSEHKPDIRRAAEFARNELRAGVRKLDDHRRLRLFRCSKRAVDRVGADAIDRGKRATLLLTKCKGFVEMFCGENAWSEFEL